VYQWDRDRRSIFENETVHSLLSNGIWQGGWKVVDVREGSPSDLVVR